MQLIDQHSLVDKGKHQTSRGDYLLRGGLQETQDRPLLQSVFQPVLSQCPCRMTVASPGRMLLSSSDGMDWASQVVL